MGYWEFILLGLLIGLLSVHFRWTFRGRRGKLSLFTSTILQRLKPASKMPENKQSEGRKGGGVRGKKERQGEGGRQKGREGEKKEREREEVYISPFSWR